MFSHYHVHLRNEQDPIQFVTYSFRIYCHFELIEMVKALHILAPGGALRRLDVPKNQRDSRHATIVAGAARDRPRRVSRNERLRRQGRSLSTEEKLEEQRRLEVRTSGPCSALTLSLIYRLP